MDRSSRSVTGPVLSVVALGALALVLVAASGVLVVRRLADDQALDEARQVTEFSARVVQRRVNEGLVTGNAPSLAAVTSVVFEAVLHEPVVRVKIWSSDGTIVYSDELQLVGDRYELDEEELDVLAHDGVVAELSDLDAPENRFERPFGQLLEVYTRIEAPDGTRLLFETYQRESSVVGTGRELVSIFAPVLIVTLIAFALLEVPLGWMLARRLRRARTERERLMQRAMGSSDRERRRIAGDLHDGPVQELAGLSMQLSAAAEKTNDGSAREALLRSASAIRASVKTLRSAIVGVYPPNLRQEGLAIALSDLLGRLGSHGIETTLQIDDRARFDADVEELLYRACQEAVRNVEQHAGARHVRVVVRPADGRAILEVADDGRGLPTDRTANTDGAHMGLEILENVIGDAGGRLSVARGDDGRGTVLRAEVPTE
jgi:two-component system, NarL family, sensor kinase